MILRWDLNQFFGGWKPLEPVIPAFEILVKRLHCNLFRAGPLQAFPHPVVR